MDTFDNKKNYTKNVIKCIWLYDWTNKRFKYVSPSIFDLTGLTVKEVMDKKLKDRLTPKSFKNIKFSLLSKLSCLLSGNINEDVDECDIYCKDGTIKKVKISTKLMINKQTDSLDIIGTSIDIPYNKN
jgi:PAS domain S-box-containing protein